MNPFYNAWLTQIWQRDTFYLYILAIMATAFLYYRWLRLWRVFKFVVAAGVIISLGGIVWGLCQW